jgi:hypothetical protein
VLRAARCALRGVWHVRCLACCALHFPVTLWGLDCAPTRAPLWRKCSGPGHLSGIIAGYVVGWKLLNWLDGPWLLVALAVLAHPLSSFPAQRYCL